MTSNRRRIVARLLLAAMVVVWSPPAFALNPRLDISQYGHTAWRISDGFPAAVINAIVQTPDGFLWLGTDDGLFKFDGVKATPWRPPTGQALPSNRIRSLEVTRDGTLWISTERGVVSWRNGGLTFYTAAEDGYLSGKILEDRDGVVWGVMYLPRLNRRIVCAFKSVEAECHGQDGGPGIGASELFEDSKGQLWVGTGEGVWRWKPAPARFHALGSEFGGIQAMAEDSTGALLISRRGRVERLADGLVNALHRFPPALKDLQFTEMLKDRDGALWLSGTSTGLLHLHQGTTDTFGEIDGLVSDVVTAMFEDREGNVWVGTAEGLQRFRDVAVATVSTRQGLPSARAHALVSSPDGGVWISTADGLTKTHPTEVIVYRERAPISAAAESHVFRRIHRVTGAGLPGTTPHSIFRDSGGRIWVSTELGVGHFDHDRFVKANGVPGGLTRGVAEDGDGTIWIVNQDKGLLSYIRGRDVTEPKTWAALGVGQTPTAVAGDPRRGVWVGFMRGVVVHVDGEARAVYGQKDGLPAGRVTNLRFDRAGTLWIATEGGLARLKAGRLATLNAAGGLPCDHAQWTLTDDAGSLWLAMPCGLVRVSSADLAAWEQDTSRRVQPTVFDTRDGFRFAPGVEYSLPVAKSNDGRLWFRSTVGVSVLDPSALPFNRLAPPVHLETITADRKVYDTSQSGNTVLRLPPLTRDLQIDYAALSLVAPEKNQFRYRLEGRDTDWQDVGNRRQAFYSDLSPGQYRFRVMASNNDGVWNEEGAAIDFEIAAAYYQTTWFIALVAGMLLTLIWAAHRLRLRIVETHEREITALNEKLMSAQEQERIRIAGELHDGVMQEMLAATMILGSAKRRVAADSDAHAAMDKVQQKLVHAGTEIRQLSHDLHPPALQDAGLPDALRTHCEDFSASCGMPITCDADDRVHDLSRGAALALFRIVQEALGNAAKHSRATRITVGLTRSAGNVTLTVTDNGVGFDRGLLTTAGGLGLITMRERAGQLNGTFEFTTAPGRGTTIKVVVPFR